MIVDSQIHVWGRNRPDRPWPAEGVHRRHRDLPEFTADDVLRVLDDAGVTGAMLVPPSFEGNWNDVVIEAVRKHPTRFVALGRFALDSPGQAAAVRSGLQAPELLGVRVTINRATAAWLDDGTLDWFWPLMIELDKPVCLYPPGHIDGVAPIARRHPDLRLCVDHFGLDLDDADPAETVDVLCRLAEFENVTVKASALPLYATDGYPFTSVHAMIRRVVATFGSERVFWGSDLSRLSVDYADTARFMDIALDGLGQSDIENVLGRALVTWFGCSQIGARP